VVPAIVVPHCPPFLFVLCQNLSRVLVNTLPFTIGSRFVVGVGILERKGRSMGFEFSRNPPPPWSVFCSSLLEAPEQNALSRPLAPPPRQV